MKILLAVNCALIGSTGGVEHVLCNMANEMAARGFEVFVATMEDKEGKPFFLLDKRIHFENLYSNFASQSKLSRKLMSFYLKLKGHKKLKDFYFKSVIWQKYIRDIRPDLVIAFSLPTLLEMTYRKKGKAPIILTVHGNPINDYTDRFWPRPKYMNDLCRKIYQNADVIQVLLDSYQSFVPSEYKGDVVTVGNVAPFVEHRPVLDYNTPKIICIGRLCHEKHQDLLIKAFARIAPKFPDWSVDLYGEGALKEQYQHLINQLGMNGKIQLKGTIQTPKTVLEKSSLFVLPSLVEGFPLVLAEAMGIGLPCIGLDCCDGTNEIIKHQKTGLLVSDDEQALAEALCQLMSNTKLRQKYGESGYQEMQKYATTKIWNQWEDLILKTINTKGK